MGGSCQPRHPLHAGSAGSGPAHVQGPEDIHPGPEWPCVGGRAALLPGGHSCRQPLEWDGLHPGSQAEGAGVAQVRQPRRTLVNLLPGITPTPLGSNSSAVLCGTSSNVD